MRACFMQWGRGYPLFLCGLPILQPRAVERYRIIHGVCMWAVRSGLGVDRSGGSEMSRVSATGLAPAGPHKQYPQNGIHTQTHASRSTRGTPIHKSRAPAARRRPLRGEPRAIIQSRGPTTRQTLASIERATKTSRSARRLHLIHNLILKKVHPPYLGER